MKFQSYFEKTVAATLIVGMLVLPLQGVAATAATYWNTDSAISGGRSATNVKNKDSGSMAKTVGISAGAGAATGALSSGVQSGVTAALSNSATGVASSAASGALSGAVGGAIMGAAGGLITATLGAAWSQIIMGTVGTLMTIIMADYFFMLGVNIDAAQLALEYMVYDAMKDVTDEWDPEPAKKYQQAAKSNESGSANVPTEDMEKDTEAAEYKWDFEVQVLKNIGIEAVNKKEINELADGRQEVLDNLSYLTYQDGELVLDPDLSHQTRVDIKTKQSQNFQWMATAGIARAELGLETAYQAAVDAGGEAATELPEVKTVDGTVPTVASSASGSDAIVMSTQAPDEEEKVALKDLPTHEQLQSTGAQMRVQSLMNLELAQRVNLANTLQGNLLSIEAARALKQAPRVLREVTNENEGDDDE